MNSDQREKALAELEELKRRVEELGPVYIYDHETGSQLRAALIQG
jgi:hypothetical protein